MQTTTMKKSLISDCEYPVSAEYRYSPHAYAWRVLIQGVICALLAVYGIFELVVNRNYLLGIFAVVGAYGAVKTFLSNMYPRAIRFEDDTVSFVGVTGSSQSYTISELKNVRLRENPSTRRLFVRMDGDNFMKGRYWLDVRFYDKPEELFWRVCDIEVASNPKSLRARARLSNAHTKDTRTK